jgi:putative transposase
VAGPKGKHDPNRRAVRHGSEPAKVPLGGRTLDVDKPRVRASDGSSEIPLETWAAVASRELLDRHTLISMLAGVSTRSYETVLEPVGPEIDQASSGTSKSAVSRRFVDADPSPAGGVPMTRARRSAPAGRRHRRLGLADKAIVGALGMDERGNKIPLAVAPGTTENKAVCRRLLNDLEDRGFDPSEGVLFVIDGGKAIHHAIKDKWSDVALIPKMPEAQDEEHL